MPEGFAIAKYTELSTLPLDGWTAEIERRLGFAWAQRDGVVSANRQVRWGMQDILAGVIREPVRGGRPIPRSYSHDRFMTSIRSMTVQDARGIAERVKQQGLEAEVSVESLNDGMSRFFDDVIITDAESDRVLLQWLGVDVEKPTAVLENEFKQWLKAAKQARAIKQVGEGVSITRWIQNQLLPCFDLVTWAWSEGDTFTDDALFDILFPDDLDADAGAKQMRQTIRPSARDLVTYRTYSRLYSAAQRESSQAV